MILRNMMMGGGRGILDRFPNAQVAYSLRALSDNFNGNVIRVERADDGVQLNIGTTIDGDLDTDTLRAFIGGGEARIVTWYDQSGNDTHLTQVTSINRPQIMNFGFLWEQGGRPAINFIPTFPTYLRNTNFNMNTNPHTLFSIASYNDLDLNLRRFLSLQRNNFNEGNWIYGSSSNLVEAGSRLPIDRRPDSIVVPTGQGQLFYMVNSDTRQELSIDGGFTLWEEGSITHVDMQQIRVGQGNSDTGDTLWTGFVQEIIIYPADMTSAKVAIEQDQADYYNL